MAHVFGWWDYEPYTRSLLNTVTGERVRYCGREWVTGALSRGTWTRFEYEHTDLRYPVLVEMKGEDHPVWHLDHVRSAALWRKEKNTNDRHPSYGVWRRVDDCLADALACWPVEVTGTGFLGLRRREPKCRELVFSGGGYNGQWCDRLQRVMASLHHPAVTFGQSEAFERNRVLHDLNTEWPSPWVYHDFHGDELSENLLLPGMEPPWNIYDASLPYSFPAGRSLKGIENKAPYLQTEDQSQLIFPTRIPPGHPIREPIPQYIKFIYVDLDVICELSGHSTGYQWIIQNAGQHFGARSTPLPENKSSFRFIGDAGFNRIGAPSYDLLIFLNWKIMDSFLVWKGLSPHIQNRRSNLDLAGARLITLREGYIGGVHCKRWQRVRLWE